MKHYLIEAFTENSGKSLGYWAESDFDFVKDEDNASLFDKWEAEQELKRIKDLAVEKNWKVKLLLTERN